jgi:hypothetical protein
MVCGVSTGATAGDGWQVNSGIKGTEAINILSGLANNRGEGYKF